MSRMKGGREESDSDSLLRRRIPTAGSGRDMVSSRVLDRSVEVVQDRGQHQVRFSVSYTTIRTS